MSTENTDPAATAAAPRPTKAQRLGATPLDEAIGLPAINVKEPHITKLTRAILLNIPTHLIFRREDTYLTVKQATKADAYGIYAPTVRPVTPNRLGSLLQSHLIFRSGDGEKAKPVRLEPKLATLIMESDAWYESMPELELILPVRLPIWGPTTEGRRTITLAPIGYDPATRTYTVETINYTTGTRQYTPAQCCAAWNSLMHTFPWGAESKAEADQVWRLRDKVIQGPAPSTNRSACATLGLMLGQYCRLLIDDLAPIGIFNANQPGSGKSLLAWLCIAPVWGMAAGTPAPKNDDEMQKAIATALKERAPYHMLDDVPVLNNNMLNMVATSNEVTARKLGGLESFLAKNHMQIFATGNGIGTSPDVERRALICDLFLADDALGRKFATPLSKKSLARPAWRADLLRLMHSMVLNWADAGCPRLVGGDAKPSFEAYAEIVGSIMVHNKFASPFKPRQYVGAGGDLIGRTVRKLLAHIVSNTMNGLRTKTYKIAEIVEISNAINLTETITGGKAPNHSMGKRLEHLRGQTLHDENGRPFEFGRKEESGASCYTFTLKD